MTLIIGPREGERDIVAPARLKEIWCRRPTDLFDPSVPLAVYKLPGDHGTDWRHMVQTPDGCDLQCNPLVEQGTALLVYEGGRVWTEGGRIYQSGDVVEVKGRKRTAFVDGGKRTNGAGVLTKVPSFGVASDSAIDTIAAASRAMTGAGDE